ncbi:MAG: GAF domain-containing protein [Bacteroidota bacterium]
MLKSRIQYVMTWVSAAVLLTAGPALMATAWNGAVTGKLSLFLMVLLWVLMSASGIYLFMLAVKKAHRLWIDEERRKKLSDAAENEPSRELRSPTQDNKSLDFTALARKLVRRTPEDVPLEEMGKELLKNLARELEVMSAVFYIRKKKSFEAVATYALPALTEPYTFREGEGLSGQVAANQQIMMLTRLPEGHLKVCSGLGKAAPSYLAIVPLVHKNLTIAVVECSGFRYEAHEIESMFRIFSRDLMEKISPKLK